MIIAAHRALVRRHHPDVNVGTTALVDTKLLNLAREWLTDPARRSAYDAARATRERPRGRSSTDSGARQSHPSSWPSERPRRTRAATGKSIRDADDLATWGRWWQAAEESGHIVRDRPRPSMGRVPTARAHRSCAALLRADRRTPARRGRPATHRRLRRASLASSRVQAARGQATRSTGEPPRGGGLGMAAARRVHQGEDRTASSLGPWALRTGLALHGGRDRGAQGQSEGRRRDLGGMASELGPGPWCGWMSPALTCLAEVTSSLYERGPAVKLRSMRSRSS